MAAAEARAAWQRAANRCFVQEDAKRAPKLPPPPPCCSSTSSSSSSVPNTNNSTNHQTNSQLHSHHHDSDEQHQLILNLTPLNWCPYPMSTGNLSAETRWWLQLHPNFAYQKEFLLYEPKNVPVNPATTDPLSPSSDFEFDQVDPPKTSHSMSFVKHTGSIDKNVEDRKLRYDVKSCDEPLMPKKRAPWWKAADGEELASMVAQKAAQHVENCDLPRPTQTLCYSSSDLCLDSSTEIGKAAFGDSGLDYACDSDHMPSRKVFLPCLCDDNLPSGLRPLCRNDKFPMEGNTREERKGSREELLEALCHSQTRAREAEIAAKKALSEKEDIMKLLLKQASHLFAYKQWLKMLQLENLCLQLKIGDHRFPFPFNSKMPTPHHPPRNKIHKRGNSICRYVVFFAVGWGLAGAGLLLGWTLGWLLPKL